jgi:hypothetical protein
VTGECSLRFEIVAQRTGFHDYSQAAYDSDWEMPEVRQRVSPLSVEEYHPLNEFNEHGRRTELIRSIVIEKTSKSPLHASLAKRLYDYIAAILPAGLVVRREDLLPLDDSEPEPDILATSAVWTMPTTFAI